ncbi:MAG TPA: c-type cytochrome domain-containing protein, partial [Gemmataceae bacterium]|nr:c-type cytochrome domain-containing protein [Gemmataceae bacterium]
PLLTASSPDVFKVMAMHRPPVFLGIFFPLLAVALVWFHCGTDHQAKAHSQPAGASKQSVSFIKDVAPIFKDNCFACHDAKKKKGKLDLTTFENLRKGGSHDDPIETGKPGESTLMDRLTQTDSGRMPPKEAGPGLPKAKIDVIGQWIKEGAKLDAGLDPKADLVRELRIRWQPPGPPAVYKFPVAVTALCFTPDHKALVVGGHHELTAWDIGTGKLICRMRTRAERAYALAFAPDGKLIVAGGRPGQEGDVRIYKLDAKKEFIMDVGLYDGVNEKKTLLGQLLDCDDSVLALALSANGKYLAAAGCDRLIRVWDVSAGVTAAKLQQSIANHADWVNGLAFSPDGKYLLSASRDNTAKIWDLAAKASVASFPGHQSPVHGVAMSVDGASAMSVGEDGALRIWQTTDKDKKLGQQLKVGKGGHTKAAFRLVVQSNAKKPLGATCSADGTVKLWDLSAGAATRTLTGLTDFVYAVAFSSDGTLVAAGGWNGEVRIWEVASGQLVKGFNASPGLIVQPKGRFMPMLKNP